MRQSPLCQAMSWSAAPLWQTITTVPEQRVKRVSLQNHKMYLQPFPNVSELTLPLPGCVWIPESDTGSGRLWKRWVTDYFQSFPCLLWRGEGWGGGGLVLLTEHRSSGSRCQTQRGDQDFPTLLISKHIVWARWERAASIESCVFYPEGRISKY